MKRTELFISEFSDINKQNKSLPKPTSCPDAIRSNLKRGWSGYIHIIMLKRWHGNDICTIGHFEDPYR